MLRVLFAIAFLVLCSCGGQELETPEDLRITTYNQGKAFTITLVMESCRDTCSTYEASECEVEVDGEMIIVDVTVPYERNSDTCAEVCSGEVLAHCEVSALPAGTYTVKSGSFRKTIEVI